MARPSKFKPEYVNQVKHLCKLGAIDKDMAAFFDVTEQTFNNWKISHPELFETLIESKEYADTQVEQALFKKATGYTTGEGDNTRHFAPDTTACIFWLKNRKSDEWKDVRERHDTVKVENEQVSNLELARRISFLLNEGLTEIPTSH